MPDHVSIIDPPRADGPAPAPERDMVTAGDFWPALSIAEFRRAERVTDEVTSPRIRNALRSAIQTAFVDLKAWELMQQAAGHAMLADVPAHMIDGQSSKLFNWQHAVFTLAKAELVETYRDYDATGAGERNADHIDPSISELRRDAAHAIRDLKGRPRTTVELI